MTSLPVLDARKRRRSEACLSDLALDQLLDADPTASAGDAAAHAHLATCTACVEAHARLAADRAAFLAEANIPALAADALARASQHPTTTHRGWRRLWPALTIVVAATAAFLLWPRSVAFRERTRVKGSLSLAVYVKHAEQTGVGDLHLGEPLHPGDQIRLRVSNGQAGFLTIFGVDTARHVTPYYPLSGHAALIGAVDAPMPTAVELDNTLGEEVIVAVRCTKPTTVDEVLGAANRAIDPERVKADPNAALSPIALPCAEARYVIKKVASPDRHRGR